MAIREAFGGNLAEMEGGLVTEEKIRLVSSMKIGELERQMKYKIQVDDTIGTLYSRKFQVFG